MRSGLLASDQSRLLHFGHGTSGNSVGPSFAIAKGIREDSPHHPVVAGTIQSRTSSLTTWPSAE
jgi:hypothetical protein